MGRNKNWAIVKNALCGIEKMILASQELPAFQQPGMQTWTGKFEMASNKVKIFCEDDKGNKLAFATLALNECSPLTKEIKFFFNEGQKFATSYTV